MHAAREKPVLDPGPQLQFAQRQTAGTHELATCQADGGMEG
jgi:hypothetical protein